MTNRFSQPSLEHALRYASEELLKTIWTCMPAEIVGRNAADDTVDVEPAIDGMDKTYKTFKRGVIRDLPVLRLGGGGWTLKFPVRIGGQGLLLVSNRGIENYVSRKGKGARPGEGLWSLDDSFFLPLSWGQDALDAPDAAVTLSDGNATLTLAPASFTLALGKNAEQSVVWDLDGSDRIRSRVV